MTTPLGATGRRFGRPVLFTLTVLVAALVLVPPALARDPWPPRLAPAANPESKGVIHPLPDAVSLLGFRASVRKPTPDDLADARALLGDAADSASFEGPGSFIYRIARPTNPSPVPDNARSAGSFVFVSATLGPIPRIQRTWFTFHQSSAEATRGVALLMPGLFGTPPATLDLLTKRLRREGWAVLRMMSQPSRFTEKAVFEIDLADPAPSIRKIAAELDDRAAECAYAVQAAFSHIAATRPALAPLPRIAVGMSGGAMTLPTVVAREPDRYAAAILIAGGCDFFTMAQESNYKYLIDAADLRWLPAPPTDDQRAAVARLYLDAASLDAYTTAAALKGKPVLMVHGDHDMAVPAHLGDLLWERLGKPERWVKTAGHEEIFFKLSADMDRMMEWLGRHTQPAKAP